MTVFLLELFLGLLPTFDEVYALRDWLRDLFGPTLLLIVMGVVSLYLLIIIGGLGIMALEIIVPFVKRFRKYLPRGNKETETEWWEKDEDPEEYKPKFKGEPE